jgi:O-antigen/teichoic acid export membrane protein
MTLFIQTFRYAAEPFFFEHSSKENAKETYANVMHYFVIICAAIFLVIMMYIDVVKYFIGRSYWGGLKIVPVLLIANLCLGVFYNLSIWYKLSGQTRWGALLAIFGAIITLVLLFWWIPLFGYLGAAWATLVCYAIMMILSYVIGQKYYPINYNLSSFARYIGTSVLLYLLSEFIRNYFGLHERPMFVINTIIMLAFFLLIFVSERDKIPYLRKPKKAD